MTSPAPARSAAARREPGGPGVRRAPADHECVAAPVFVRVEVGAREGGAPPEPGPLAKVFTPSAATAASLMPMSATSTVPQ